MKFSLRSIFAVILVLALLIRLPVIAAISASLLVVACLAALPWTWKGLGRLGRISLAGAAMATALSVSTAIGLQGAVKKEIETGDCIIGAENGNLIFACVRDGRRDFPARAEWDFVAPPDVSTIAIRFAGTAYASQLNKGGECLVWIPSWWLVATLTVYPAVLSARSIQLRFCSGVNRPNSTTALQAQSAQDLELL